MKSTDQDDLVGPLLSVAEACKALNVSRQLIYRLIADGQLPVVKIGDRTLFRPRDVAMFVEQNLRASVPAAHDLPHKIADLSAATKSRSDPAASATGRASDERKEPS
jgi:excisionase family DNA binding protein